MAIKTQHRLYVSVLGVCHYFVVFCSSMFFNVHIKLLKYIHIFHINCHHAHCRKKETPTEAADKEDVTVVDTQYWN